MEDQHRVEDSFRAAALSLCGRWECFHFEQLGPPQTVELDEPVEYPARSAVQTLTNRIETLGAVEAAGSLLRSRILSDLNVELSAHNRLDLTLEALCLRPAWSNLFTAEE